MNVQYLYNDKNCTIKNVYYGETNKLLYAIVYLKDCEGYCKKTVSIFPDGTVSQQKIDE